MEIRKANKEDHCTDISALMYSSGPEIYDFIHRIGLADPKDFIDFEFKTGKGFCGYRNLTVAVSDDRVIAVGAFFDGKKYNALMMGTLVNMLKYYGIVKIWSALKRASYSDSVMKKPKNDEFYVSNFAVLEDMRGKGIGTTIIKDKIKLAKSKGYKLFSLDVADNNPQAEKLYSKLGLTVKDIKQFTGNRPGIDFPKIKKMEMVIA